MRTYVYKMTSDRGGAPCAPPPGRDEAALLTLALCKPAIRRTAQPGDRLLGLTSRALAEREAYPACAVIFAARVTGAVEFGRYYDAEGPYARRPDCVYALDAGTGELQHGGRTALHAEPAYLPRDVGRAPLFRNARTLLSEEFRYFGAEAVEIPGRMPQLRQVAESLGQGHRAFAEDAPEAPELDRLFALLWRRPTRYTPARVETEAPGHAPR